MYAYTYVLYIIYNISMCLLYMYLFEYVYHVKRKIVYSRTCVELFNSSSWQVLVRSGDFSVFGDLLILSFGDDQL